jgi:putative phage-type endonuclease
MIEILTPSSREEWLSLRKDTIGASEVAAVLGVHPYITPYELWARKTNWDGYGVQQETNAMRRGRLLEGACIEILREERPWWTIVHNPIPSPDGQFFIDAAAGISATPDAFVQSSATGRKGICQIKTVNEHVFRNQWADGSIKVPAHIAIQVIQEAHLTDSSWACVAAFVGMDLEPYILGVELHNGIINRILNEVPYFLRRVRENDPPEPDYARDADAIKARFAEDDGGEIDLSGNPRVNEILYLRQTFKHDERAGAYAETERKKLDAELIDILGNATRGDLGNGEYIEAKTVRKKECVHPATTYRPITLKKRKEK